MKNLKANIEHYVVIKKKKTTYLFWISEDQIF